MMLLHFSIDEHPDHTIVTIRGELDVTNSDQLQKFTAQVPAAEPSSSTSPTWNYWTPPA